MHTSLKILNLFSSKLGDVVAKLPLPPGAATTLWQNDQRYIDSYLTAHKGYYLTGDAGFIDSEGYVHIMSRIDDVINVAGHRLSTGEMEEVAASHHDVAECAVIGVADNIKGEIPMCFAVLKAGAHTPHAQISTEIVQLVRNPGVRGTE